MSTKAKIQILLSILFGCVFLGIGIYQWYDLHQIEMGEKDGTLSYFLNAVYNVAGKWGVALVYMPFAIYCFWRANVLIRFHKGNQELGSYEDENKENEK